MVERARTEDLVPVPDVDVHRWSRAVADEVAHRAEEITTTIGAEHPIGASRAANRLAERTGLEEIDGAHLRQAPNMATCTRSTSTRTDRCSTAPVLTQDLVWTARGSLACGA